MSDKEETFLSRDEALSIVAAIQEEEDIERKDHRILTVYNHDNEEVCWFDYDEVIEAVLAAGKTKTKSDVQDYVIEHIPAWAKK